NGTEGDPPATYYCDFGDGGNANAKDPIYQYQNAGIYNVSLIVTDIDGDSDQRIRINYIIVNAPSQANTPPNITLLNASATIDISVSDTSATLAFKVTDAEQAIGYYFVGNATYVWDNGTWTDDTAVYVSLYGLPVGTYAFGIYVNDTLDGSDSLAITINVNNEPPFVNFTWQPPDPLVGEAVMFQDLSSDTSGNIVAWYWDFGDGSVSRDQNPIHVYTSAGNYIVRLTVTDEYGANGTHEMAISISAEPPPPPQEEIPGYSLSFLVLFMAISILSLVLFKFRRFLKN
ncbi:MAG: PKD domain-containing protein, partial [Promethearchaeota archaeon]